MFELSVLIPVADNSGALFTDADHAAFESFVLDRFGGLTFQANEADGLWRDAGVTYRDRTRLCLIAVKSLAEGDKIAEVVAFAKSHYRQLAICIRYLGQVEIL